MRIAAQRAERYRDDSHVRKAPMFDRILRRLRATLALLLVPLAVLGAPASTRASAPVRCAANPPGPGCCALTPFRCDATTVSPVDPNRRNILLVIADDLAYCHYGFMGTNPPGAFHLKELTCRNRDPNATLDSPHGAFPFDRSGADSTSVVVRTPALDDLAQHAAVFPRAQVAGVACAPSRRTIMLGKHQRHLAYLFGANGDGSMECHLQTKGCRTDADCPKAGDFCTNVRTLPRVLRDLTGEDYQTFGVGKIEFIDNNTGFNETADTLSHTNLGQFRCTDGCGGSTGTCCSSCAQCEADLGMSPLRVPVEASNSVHEVFDFIERKTIQSAQSRPAATSFQTHPFFVWYAPEIPHQGNVADPHFLALYPDLPDAERQHLARISWLDVGVQAIEEYLQGSCVCAKSPGGAPVKQSLYDSTVVMVIGDQGFLLPASKGEPTENNLRQVLIVSDPRQRKPAPTVPPHVFSADFAHVADIMQTMLGYADVPPPLRPAYWFARDLKPIIENPNLGPIRNIQFGEPGKQSITASVGPHFAINRPGLVGVCANGVDPKLGYTHHRPCVRDADCTRHGAAEGPCVRPGQPMSNRCVNRPDLRCGKDADCAPSLCRAGRCQHAASLGSYKDFDGKACAGDANCVPPGVCQPLMLKAFADGQGAVNQLWDINFDPDETQDLLALDGDYLGPCIRSEFEHCLFGFRLGGAPYLPFIPPPSCHPAALCGPLAWCGRAYRICP
jgi:arylsulfatase A-like enzyme